MTIQHPNIVQAANIWGSVMEKVVEGKESAAEKVTMMKEATVEKVNSMKESVDDAIALQSDSPVRNLMIQLFILATISNLMAFLATLVVVITMTVLQALEATWFGLGSSGKGQLDESQVFKNQSSARYICMVV